MAIMDLHVTTEKAADLWWSRWTAHTSVWMTGDTQHIIYSGLKAIDWLVLTGGH